MHIKEIAIKHDTPTSVIWKIIFQKNKKISYIGEKIPNLLNWYLEYGLVVTSVYQTIQYWPKDCFKTFGEKVSQDIYKGDADSDQAIIADTMKLLGNSAYGKTITNKDHH